jgi:hypothetical protein
MVIAMEAEERLVIFLKPPLQGHPSFRQLIRCTNGPRLNLALNYP